MARKSKKDINLQVEQLSLPIEEDLESEQLPESDDDWLSGDFGFEESNRTIEPPARELLTLKLLREAIRAQHREDVVMLDFAEYALPNLLKVAIGEMAKGGKFTDKLEKEKAAKGEVLQRRNATDQSLNTHLLNGLFPANIIEQRLEKIDTTIKRVVRERERRLVIAAFILHDFEKFPNSPENCRTFALEQQRQIIDKLVRQLELDRFISPNNPEVYREYLDDLLYMADNAQRRWDTNLNLSEYGGLNPVLKDRTLRSLSDLTCLADSLASIVKHPQDAENNKLTELIHNLSDGKLRFTYHQIAENRGVLTNVVNNALMEAHTSLNTDECIYYEPLLYLPTGVIYLAGKDAPTVDLKDLPDRVVIKIKQLCAGQLRLRQTGFSRDGKGMKYAEYYNLFFDDRGLMQVALDATLRILTINKGSVAKSRSDNLVKFQQQGVLPSNYDFQFKDNIRIDQIAEFGDLIDRKIWGERINKIEAVRKQNKKLPELSNFNLIQKVAEVWDLTEYLPQVRDIQRINESLREQGLKGNTGGVPYEWYYLAAKYLEHNPGIEDVREICKEAIAHISDLIEPIIAQYEFPDGWDDLRLWVERVVMLPTQQPRSISAQTEVFLRELGNYNAAKKQGRGKQAICSVSHSAYTVTEQMESAVLFTPQVYTNKQMLGGSNAKRNISSIAGIEMMLRQILMNQTQAVGKRFEDGKYRYLYFYPTYYFTPETNKFLQKAYNCIAQTRFDTSIRNHFISKDLKADFGRDKYQTVDSFLIDAELERKKNLPEKDPQYKRDRTFKLFYPDDQPLTFYFMALPPGKEPTDTESWIMPTWLGFAFPMILDVKTVVSESPIPPFNDGAEFEESVFLDSAPQAFRVLLGRDRFRLDYILEGWEDSDSVKRPAPLNVLTAAYAIHLDVNAKQGKAGYDSNWGRFTELAKDFDTSPLYVFSYLNRWVRNQGIETARIEKIKLYTYHFYPCFDPYVQFNAKKEELTVAEESLLNHPMNLTALYRRFYKADRRYNPKANAILKPIDIAAKVVLDADESFQGQTLIHEVIETAPSFQSKALVAAVAAEISKLMDRVRANTAEGQWVISNREEERQAILKFAEYFVFEVFEKSFAGDRARLSGKQINLLKDTCEFLYRLENDRENQAKNQNPAGTNPEK